MLYDPNWDKPTAVAFRDWLRTMPAGQWYNWGDWRNCACAQFYGQDTDWIPLNREIADREGINLNSLALRGGWTFGSLLERVERALYVSI